MINKTFWRGKRVFLTGHTGFKGAWMSIWLIELGAEVWGYALDPPTEPSLFEKAGLATRMHSIYGDIRDRESLKRALEKAKPEVIIHMAAQPLVRLSYEQPLLTYETNVMGTANLLEAIRGCESMRAVVLVTTDKCYENKEWDWGYRENEPLGGYDPYSSSKACAEIVAAAYRSSFFNPKDYGRTHNVAIATARAGNVIGGGDWAKDRLVPDIVKAIGESRKVFIRSPESIRPWQYVLEPLAGYLLLSERLYTKGVEFAEAWNFGPYDSDVKPVGWIVDQLCKRWPGAAGFESDTAPKPHEALYLKLDCSKAINRLGWKPTWSLETALAKIVEWNLANLQKEDMYALTVSQIQEFAVDFRKA
ncbi:MAG: CDP-glucose 4,6-dehydratase [Rectinemataceae bacterium]|nr:CDP-glucose 4,6-dehydratase [Rectinemataceae bacterium]